MEYINLGRTGLHVSRICLGTMNFGAVTEEKEAFRIMDAALDAGINFILKESSPFREPLKLKMPVGSGHDETDGG